MPKKGELFVWWVEHPDHTVAVVIAPNWEQATVKAAEWWDVPWGKVAAMCTEQKKKPIKRGVCCECGSLVWGSEGVKARCGKCESIARSQEESRKARNRRFYAEMHKEQA